VPLSAFLSVGITAEVSASDSEGRGVTLRSFAGRLPMSRTRYEQGLRDLRHTCATMRLRRRDRRSCSRRRRRGSTRE
jgi:hypothetical protein